MFCPIPLSFLLAVFFPLLCMSHTVGDQLVMITLFAFWCLQYSCIRAIGGVFFSVVVDPLGVLLVGEARP